MSEAQKKQNFLHGTMLLAMATAIVKVIGALYKIPLNAIIGAQAQGRSAQCGMLVEGMDADIALVDFSAPHLMPCHNVLNGLVWSAKGGDVAMTMVRGKILYQNGTFPTIDLTEVVEELTTYAIPKLFEESK